MPRKLFQVDARIRTAPRSVQGHHISSDAVLVTQGSRRSDSIQASVSTIDLPTLLDGTVLKSVSFLRNVIDASNQ